ncbi:MAG: hypothetical protein U9N73_01610 [Candidatus Auribacterota bacterium]|nr:hypothetical protein [Candidatus Auribacterota bacterium]
MMKVTTKFIFAALLLAAVLFPVSDCWPGLGDYAARSYNTNYLAATDGFVVASAYINPGNHSRFTLDMQGYTDSSNPPSTLRAQSGYIWAAYAGSYTAGFTMPVKSGNWWRVAYTGKYSTLKLFWVPLTP